VWGENSFSNKFPYLSCQRFTNPLLLYRIKCAEEKVLTVPGSLNKKEEKVANFCLIQDGIFILRLLLTNPAMENISGLVMSAISVSNKTDEKIT
jgi:hypothetical protein